MTADPMLDLVRAALTAKLATDLGDRTSARSALFEVARLLPLAKVRVQQLRERPDDPRDLDSLLDAKYPPPSTRDDTDNPTEDR